VFVSKGYNSKARFYFFIDYRRHHRKGIAICDAIEDTFTTEHLVNNNAFFNAAKMLKLEKDL
jgi:hypothetical protein